MSVGSTTNLMHRGLERAADERGDRVALMTSNLVELVAAVHGGAGANLARVLDHHGIGDARGLR